MFNCAGRDSSLDSRLPPFDPALRIDGQSLPQGSRITSASEGQEFHLHEKQVIKDPKDLSSQSLTLRPFLGNGSQLPKWQVSHAASDVAARVKH
jgi:hypothetical protein